MALRDLSALQRKINEEQKFFFGATPIGASVSRSVHWNEDAIFPRTPLGWLEGELYEVTKRAWR